MLNRKIGPHITNDFNLRVDGVQLNALNNGIKLYELNTGSQDIVKVELVFRTGRIHEPKPAVAKATFAMLKEGSENLNSSEMAELLDYHGAVFKSECHMEFAYVSLVCMNEHFGEVWKAWLDAVLKPAFDPVELEKYKELNHKRLQDQLSKNDVIAYRTYTEYLFGDGHPYGYNTEPEHIQSLTSADLKDFYNQHCQLGRAFIILSGKYDNRIRDRVTDSLGNLMVHSTDSVVSFPVSQPKLGTHRIRTENLVQTNIKTGELWVERDHKDYVGLKTLNTIFGGYFGSRLMRNIREEKGYTYGIYSSFDALQHAGYFYISGDVGTEYIDPTLEEIRKEIKSIKNEYIEDDELKMVKNYLLGQSLNLIDGPFATAQLVKSLSAKNLDLNTFENAVSEIKRIDRNRLIELANKYIHEDSFVTVLVGNV